MNEPIATKVNAYDPIAGLMIKRVNLWADYADREKGTTGKAVHGDEVEIVAREGEYCKLRLQSGVEGWALWAFVRDAYPDEVWAG